MLEAVIFDLDGVIVDSHPAHMQAWRALLESVGKNVSDDDLQYVLDGHKREEILRHFVGDLSFERARSYGEQKDALFRKSSTLVKLIGGVREFLKCLQTADVTAGVATSASKRRAECMLRDLNLEQNFRVIVAAEDVVRSKPDPEIFLQAASLLKVAPKNALVCEDAVSGVLAAKSAGMKCLGIASNGRGAALFKAGADRVVPDFTSVRMEELRRLWRRSNVNAALAAD